MMKTLSAGLLILALCALLPAQGKKLVGLPDGARSWLEEEVAYIITPKEREVFLKLGSDKERDIFIEAFWKQRDPTPGTPKNEFREEHYGRLQYANKFYGRSTPLPGWKTDRGRIYIILGAPKSIEQFDQTSNVYPTEIWSYLGDPAQGLPPAFNVIFFKEHGIGDYVLYSPSQHGPEALIASNTETGANFRDERTAYEELKKLAPNLAYQTLSLIPGERNTPGMLSLASNTLIGNIYALPRKMVKDSYADALLKYKDFVEVDYTANYFESDGQVWVVRDPSGFFEVHYAIEPKKISVEDAGDRFDARFELNGRVTDASGRTILQFDKPFPFAIDKEEGQKASMNVSIQDAFPIIAGRYTLDLLLKNVASREFTSVTAKIEVPAGVTAPALGPIILAYGASRKPGSGERTPFAVGGTQVLSVAQKVFASGETLSVVLQALGLTDALRAEGRLKTTYFKEDTEFSSFEKTLKDLQPGDLAVLDQPLSAFAPGYYKVRVELLDGKGARLDAKSADFELSTRPSIPRPMVVAVVATAYGREDYLYATGLELMNAGDLKGAASRLAEAYALKPGHPNIAAAYGLCLLTVEDFGKAKEVLTPLVAGGQGRAEILAALGRTHHALGEFAEAAALYREYLERFGANIEVMNLLGTCSFKMGNKEEALKAWEKSLEISPDQPQIRKLVDELKK
ncbi:MAG TPA: GWxTD domain-containing protein [Acidobacteriota bacterium]|nr:GWxTD domain-containing protein [Acidobacteriota bacterium]